jgi:hypothetical protein
MGGNALEDGGQRSNFDGMVVRNYFVVLTVKLGCDSDCRPFTSRGSFIVFTA